MADERDDDQFGETKGSSGQQAGGQAQQNERGQQAPQPRGPGSEPAAGSQGRDEGFGSQSSGGSSSGQPIGGNDSQIGSGTTLSHGADVGRQSSSRRAPSTGGSGPPPTSD